MDLGVEAFSAAQGEGLGGVGGDVVGIGDFILIDGDSAGLDQAASFAVTGSGTDFYEEFADGQGGGCGGEFGDFGRQLAAGEDALEFFACLLCGLGAVKKGDDFLSKLFFGFHGMQGGVDGVPEEDFTPLGGEGIGDAHGFAKHFFGGIVDGDGVAEGFAHFFGAIGAFE